MKTMGYQLYVERESSSFTALKVCDGTIRVARHSLHTCVFALQNGTEIFKRLFNLMADQHLEGSQQPHAKGNDSSSLVASVKDGVNLIMGGSLKVLIGGRETLYFNLKRHGTNYLYTNLLSSVCDISPFAGIHNFQLSEKLYTRYSAVAVQIGCPFIESLNEVCA